MNKKILSKPTNRTFVRDFKELTGGEDECGYWREHRFQKEVLGCSFEGFPFWSLPWTLAKQNACHLADAQEILVKWMNKWMIFLQLFPALRYIASCLLQGAPLKRRICKNLHSTQDPSPPLPAPPAPRASSLHTPSWRPSPPIINLSQGWPLALGTWGCLDADACRDSAWPCLYPKQNQADKKNRFPSPSESE